MVYKRHTHFIGSHIIWATVGYGGGQNYISASWHIATVVLLLSLVGSNAFDIKSTLLCFSLLHKWQNDQNIFLAALPSPSSPIITQHIFLAVQWPVLPWLAHFTLWSFFTSVKVVDICVGGGKNTHFFFSPWVSARLRFIAHSSWLEG